METDKKMFKDLVLGVEAFEGLIITTLMQLRPIQNINSR